MRTNTEPRRYRGASSMLVLACFTILFGGVSALGQQTVQVASVPPDVTAQAATPQEPAPPTISISAEKRQLIGVRTAAAELKALDKQVRTVGKVDVDETRLSYVNTKVAGWVRKLYVDYTGREVVKGEPLLSIYSPDLVTAQEEYLLTVQGGEGGSGDYQQSLRASAKRRLLLWDITSKQIAELERSGKPRTELKLAAPQSGIVIEKMVLEGAYVMPGTNLYKIADLSQIWVIADIYEYEVPLVKIGQRARVTLPYATSTALDATVSYIYPSLDPMTRTVKARLSMKNPGLMLKPEMFANVEILVAAEKRLVIPSEAVLDSGTRQVVYVEKKPGTFEMRQVRLGVRGDRSVEVLAGLQAGDKVVTSGNFLIDSETQLRTGQ